MRPPPLPPNHGIDFFSIIELQPSLLTDPTVAIPFSSSSINPFSFIRRLIVPGNQAGISAYPIDFLAQ
jgi:hypothetical protein